MTPYRTFEQTIEHYRQLRQFVYEDVEAEYKSLNLKAGAVTLQHAREADLWNTSNTHIYEVGWSWQEMYNLYNAGNEIKRFELAITVGPTLCGLCYGVPSRGKLILKLHVLQGNPHLNKLTGQILKIFLYAANVYADLLGSIEVWICNPMNDRLVRLYEDHGFTPSTNHANKITHLSKEVGHD